MAYFSAHELMERIIFERVPQSVTHGHRNSFWNIPKNIKESIFDLKTFTEVQISAETDLNQKEFG